MKRGLTLLELLVVLSLIGLSLMLFLPSYHQHVRLRTLQVAARILEFNIRERKARAVALGAPSGLCVGPTGIRRYEFHPLSPALAFFDDVIQFRKNLGASVSIQMQPINSTSTQNPCTVNEQYLWLTPSVNTGEDWQGSMTLQSDSSVWHVNIAAGGVMSDGP